MDNPEKLATQGTQDKYTLQNTEGAIKNGQFRDTGNIGYTRRRKTKQRHNTICFDHYYTQAKTNNVNKTRVILQTIAGKDEPNIVLSGNSNYIIHMSLVLVYLSRQ